MEKGLWALYNREMGDGLELAGYGGQGLSLGLAVVELRGVCSSGF